MKKSTCLLVNLGLILICCAINLFWWFTFDETNYTSSLPIIMISSVAIFYPFVLYICYLKSEVNKIFGFLLSAISAYACFNINKFTYHFRTNFIYWNDAKTQAVQGLQLSCQIIIGLLFLIIYFWAWYAKKRGDNR